MRGRPEFIRPPQQRRSQASLERVLEAGLELLQEEGYAGFTLAKVSERSGVSIGSIYARFSGREALLATVFERAMEWTAEQSEIEREAIAQSSTPRERVEAAVRVTGQAMLAHGKVLEVFMREGAVNPSVYRRGSEKSRETGTAFVQVLLEHREEFAHADPDLAVDIAWRLLYNTLARRLTHGPGFESPRPISDDQLITELTHVIGDYLLDAAPTAQF